MNFFCCSMKFLFLSCCKVHFIFYEWCPQFSEPRISEIIQKHFLVSNWSSQQPLKTVSKSESLVVPKKWLLVWLCALLKIPSIVRKSRCPRDKKSCGTFSEVFGTYDKVFSKPFKSESFPILGENSTNRISSEH